MTDAEPTGKNSKAMLWAGRVISGIPALMLTMSAVMKLLQSEAVGEGLTHLGWPTRYAVGLGILELACAMVYAVPRTAFVGAILVTGYMGGAIATHVRLGELNVFLHCLLGILTWLGLYLRDARLRALVLHRPDC